MSQGGAFAVWDVVKVGFPYADGSTVRRRPALVIAAPAVHARFSVLWVLMITTAQRGARPGDVDFSDLAGTGLSVPCCVRTEKVATVDTRFAEAIGRLTVNDRRQVADKIRRLLGSVLLMQH